MDFVVDNLHRAVDHLLPQGGIHLAFEFVDECVERFHFHIPVVGLARTPAVAAVDHRLEKEYRVT